MPGVDDGVLFPEKVLREWTEEIFKKIGINKQDTTLLTDTMIEANLQGVDTHGITRLLPAYVNRIRTGLMLPATKVTILREKASTALINCNNGIGQVASDFAMNMAIEKAKTTGTAFVATTHSNHYGAAAYWAVKALKQGMIGFSATNGPASVAPTGGIRPMLGPNPFAVAIPAKDEHPFVLDLATSVVARGRIRLYAMQNKPLEPGWAFDKMGRPTTDPREALQGLLVPIGGYKGYGIALAIDLMSGVMTGSKYGAHFPNPLEHPTDVGSLFGAISIDSFMDLPEFTASVDTAIREIKNCAKAEGVKRIYVPGEIEMEIRTVRLANGIPIPPVVIREFENLGSELGVPFPV